MSDNVPAGPVISLIIPVYNEADHLEQFLEAIDRMELPAAKELVIVNDFSTDASAEIIRNFNFQSKSVFIEQPRNQGKGAAIRTGLQQLTGDFIGIQDADFEYSLEDIPGL